MVIGPYVRPGSVNGRPYNHYGLLRSIEDIFGLPHLGYAAQPGLAAFGSDVLSPTRFAAPRAPARRCRSSRRGKPIRALRLRGNLLSFRTRRRARVTIRSRLRDGRLVRRRRPRRVRACRIYQLRLPRTVVRAGIRIGKHSYRVRRTRSGAHG